MITHYSTCITQYMHYTQSSDSVLGSFRDLRLVMNLSYSRVGGFSGPERNNDKGSLHVADSRWLTEVQQQLHLEGRPNEMNVYIHTQLCSHCKCI